MFRQILVHPEDRRWQNILWRSNRSESIQECRLSTVTYGTSPAPFLAIRTLLQLAEEGKSTHPEAAAILRSQVYVDDIFAGADTLGEATLRRDQLVSLLAGAGMQLGKWASNTVELLEGIEGLSEGKVSVDIDEIVSALGLKWSPNEDELRFKIDLPTLSVKITKRLVLSETARLFDPLGFLAPIIVVPKILMQDMWIEKSDWDVALLADLERRWLAFRDSLNQLSEIRIVRAVGVISTKNWSLHGFCDASKRAYAAAVYCVTSDGKSTLLMAKSKVAPVKTQSLSRLELCGAVLLARLTDFIIGQLKTKPKSISFWSDSQVVLDWLKSHPSRWPVFVANRVSKVLARFPRVTWSHVRSADNPADIATRGVTPSRLALSELWWHGPAWQGDEIPPSLSVASIEGSQAVASLVANEVEESSGKVESEALTRLRQISKYSKILRVLVVIFRWRLGLRVSSANRKRSIPMISRLLHLAPFIDKDEVLRVGGRLQNSVLTFKEKHPVILPADEPLVRRLVEYSHSITMHGGVALMRSYLDRFCWIVHVVRVKTAASEFKRPVIKLIKLPVDQELGVAIAQINGSATSFEDLQNFRGILYNNNKDTAINMGLIEHDIQIFKIFDKALQMVQEVLVKRFCIKP
ncbi:uncharacterized protein LOC106638278 [Copidosoma floridanum]|uniref:uncharacterized protein LOC106638278 n=1 Tax=Copidosoma floridanum TaxID=29053 RepID=UPI0006C9C6A4|nr:uncharacterized protein LOC106638278 [Copidosoma floridanum]